MRGLLGEGEGRGWVCLERGLLVVVAWRGCVGSEEEVGIGRLLLICGLKRDALGLRNSIIISA